MQTRQTYSWILSYRQAVSKKITRRTNRAFATQQRRRNIIARSLQQRRAHGCGCKYSHAVPLFSCVTFDFSQSWPLTSMLSWSLRHVLLLGRSITTLECSSICTTIPILIWRPQSGYCRPSSVAAFSRRWNPNSTRRPRYGAWWPKCWIWCIWWWSRLHTNQRKGKTEIPRRILFGHQEFAWPTREPYIEDTRKWNFPVPTSISP